MVDEEIAVDIDDHAFIVNLTNVRNNPFMDWLASNNVTQCKQNNSLEYLHVEGIYGI